MDELISRLKLAISAPLPGEQAHLEMSPLKRPSGNFPERQSARLSAVAVILTEVENEATVLLTQRHEYDGAHSGQISFPGGKKEESDPDLEFTARRECFEEVGIHLQKEALISPLTEVYIPVSKFIVQPYLYLHPTIETLSLNEREVKEVIHFPLNVLRSEHSRSTMDIHSKEGLIYRNVPCFRTGEKKIWGATALILNELKYLLSYQK
jgi:8-oxo-dGTP pyrophosphatase MutT (NUDIX family)